MKPDRKSKGQWVKSVDDAEKRSFPAWGWGFLNQGFDPLLFNYRNPIIARMLKDCKFAEKTGRGLQKSMKFHDRNNLKPPDFDIDGEYFKSHCP